MNYQVPSLTFLHRFKKAATVSVMAAGLFLSTSATAGLIPNGLTTPDIYSSGIELNYVEGTELLTASGFALTYKDDAQTIHNIANGSFDLNASISNGGVLNTGTMSNLTIDGTIAGLATSGTLLEGALSALGFDSLGTADDLEFLFTVTGGDLASAYGGFGATGGVILSYTGFGSGLFNVDFTDGFSTVADVGVPVPEPAGLLLICSGLLGLIVSRRRRS